MAPILSSIKENQETILARWTNPDHWQLACPHLTIPDTTTTTTTTSTLNNNDQPYNTSNGTNFGAAKNALLRQRLINDGYALINTPINGNSKHNNSAANQTPADNPREAIACGISELETKHSLPATFILLFDETWNLAAVSCKMLLSQKQTQQQAQQSPQQPKQPQKHIQKQDSVLHPKMKFNFDMLAWHIDPRRCSSTGKILSEMDENNNSNSNSNSNGSNCNSSSNNNSKTKCSEQKKQNQQQQQQWHQKNQAGFSPHRDRQPETIQKLQQSFYNNDKDDGDGGDGGAGGEGQQAKYVTHWIALTDATPENSCLYVIPKQFDPGYLGGDDVDDNDEDNGDGDSRNDDGNGDNEMNDANNNKGANITNSDPLTRALPTKQSYQNIRALPRNAGQSIIFTHRILHWGSRGNPYALEEDAQPRIAISFVFSDGEFEEPYLKEDYFSIGNRSSCSATMTGTVSSGGSGGTTSSANSWNYPPFSIRLLLVCAQLLIYYQRFNLSTATLRACYEYCKLHSEELNDAYRKKVFVEFVKAMKEKSGSSGGGGSVDAPLVDNDGRDKHNGNATNGSSTTNNLANQVDVSNNDGADSDDEEALLEAMLNHQEEFDDDFDEMGECCGNKDDNAIHAKKKKRKQGRVKKNGVAKKRG